MGLHQWICILRHQRCKGCWRIGCFDEWEPVQRGWPRRWEGERPRWSSIPSSSTLCCRSSARGIFFLYTGQFRAELKNGTASLGLNFSRLDRKQKFKLSSHTHSCSLLQYTQGGNSFSNSGQTWSVEEVQPCLSKCVSCSKFKFKCNQKCKSRCRLEGWWCNTTCCQINSQTWDLHVRLFIDPCALALLNYFGQKTKHFGSVPPETIWLVSVMISLYLFNQHIDLWLVIWKNNLFLACSMRIWVETNVNCKNPFHDNARIPKQQREHFEPF